MSIAPGDPGGGGVRVVALCVGGEDATAKSTKLFSSPSKSNAATSVPPTFHPELPPNITMGKKSK